MMNISVKRVREVLVYDPETGVFTWRASQGRCKAGAVAGTVQATKGGMYRRRVICVDGKMCKAHRLAWLWVHNEWPDGEIDHINGDATDNRLVNLRVTDRLGNLRNRRAPSHKLASKLKGVSVCAKSRGRWRARIRVAGVEMHLGTFGTEDAAHAAYAAAAKQHFGEFARL